ncbi:MAG: hypothetical protein HYZ25_16395 [Chloroflexi bacterium]|nr:hypothetical protein [Chloroflexota bacterium]
MKDSFRHPESNTQPSVHLLVSLQILDDIQKWLVGLIWLTEEEQKEAGLYLDDQHDKVNS